MANLDHLASYIDQLKAAMQHVADELADDADIDNYGRPNKAMRLANELKEAMYGPGGF